MKQNYFELMKFILISLIVISSGTSLACAQGRTVEQLWNELQEAVEKNDSFAVLCRCNDLIMSTEPFNEYAQRCRYILAKMDLLENRMNDIYEDFTYFDALARKGIASDNYLALRNELKTAYDSLLIEDLQKPISEGVYFSDYQDGNHHPLMLLKISKGSNGLEAIQLQGGQVANDNMLRKYGGVLRGSEILQNNETLMYNAFWSGTRSRRPNTEMAHSTVEESQNFKEEMYGTMARGQYSTGDVVAGTIATEAVGGLMSLLGAALAKGKVTSCIVQLDWKPIGNGQLSAYLTVSSREERTGSVPEEDNQHFEFTLFKLYPHHKIFFYDPQKDCVVNYDGCIYLKSINYKLFERTHPAFFEEYIESKLSKNKSGKKTFYKLDKYKDLNGLMYKFWEYNSLFASLQTDSMREFLLPLDEMQSVYASDGSLSLGQYDKKINDFRSFVAFRMKEGHLVYMQCPTNIYNSTRKQSIYFIDNSYIYGEFIGPKQQGKCRMRYSDGGTFVGDAVEMVRHGYGIRTWPGGQTYTGTYNNGKEIDGEAVYKGTNFTCKRRVHQGVVDSIAIISYSNGDIYKGKIGQGYLPNGSGIMTYADGRTTKGEWEKGKLVANKPITRNIKRKISNKRKTTR